MGVQVTGLRAVQAEIDDALREVNVESEHMLSVMLQAIAANTAPYVPVDTSALIGSELRETHMTPEGPAGSISYGLRGGATRGTPVSEYAIHVHEGPQKNWQKPGASNQYLAKGLRDFLRDDLSGIIAAFKRG